MKILVRAEALREGLPGGPGGAGSRSEILRFGRRPDSVGFAIMSIIISGRFRGPEGSGPIWGVFGGSETGRLEGRPERPPSSTTRSKSTHSSRLCSVSLSSVLFRSVLLRDVVVGKIFFLRPEVGSDFCLRPEVGLENYISTSGRSRWTGHVVGHRGRRALTVDARSFTSDRGRIQKPARHRSRSENENFAQF